MAPKPGSQTASAKMMPIAAGEEVPPMSEWMKHQFGE
jgi:hypothetical protein